MNPLQPSRDDLINYVESAHLDPDVVTDLLDRIVITIADEIRSLVANINYNDFGYMSASDALSAVAADIDPRTTS